MDLDLTFERVYPHPIESVWKAVSTREGLAAWLMDSDFAPEVGRSFTFRFCDEGEDGAPRAVFAEVLELEAPRRIVWRWRNEREPEATRVEIDLEETSGGTRLVLRHTGPISEETGGALESGWPRKLEGLAGLLGSPAPVRPGGRDR
jgi:uncharacterized protein YndB with AHSA1/START domain